MTFKKRLAVLEKSAHRHNYVPPFIIDTIVDLSVDGPRKRGLLLNFKQMEFVKGLSAKQMKLRGSLSVAFSNNLN